MNSHGGRRIITLSCCLLLGAMAACSGGSDEKNEAAEDAEVTAGRGSAAGSSGGFASFDAGAGLSGPGLSVRGVASGTVPADVAFVVVIPPGGGLEALSGSAVSTRDRKTVMDSVAALGIPRGDITFEGDPRLGAPRVQVKVAVNQVASRGPRIVEAVERTLGRSESSGVSYSLASCEPASAGLRKQAMAQAEGQAKALAEAGKLSIGGIVAIRQDADVTLFRAPPPSGVCPLATLGPVETFDTKPEVRLSVAVSVSYAINGAPAGSEGRPIVFSAGSATVKAKADEAYVMLLFESEDEQPTGGPSAENRAKLIEALGRLKIDGKDVEITTQSDYGVTTIVQVETKAEGLATSGKDIVRAVEDVLGRADTSGVRFWSSACTDLLAKGRKEAVADARQRAGALAEAAGVKLGPMQWLAEGGAGCDDSIEAAFGLDDYVLSPLQPFDAEPEFTLATSAQVGFLIG